MLYTKQAHHAELFTRSLLSGSSVIYQVPSSPAANLKWKSTTTTTTKPQPPYKQFNKLKKLSRKEEAEQQAIAARNSLQHLDLKYDILTPSTKKVLDIGFAPGHWMSYIVDRISQLHNVESTKLHTVGVHILGFDILFKSPPLGTSSIQGNIFSKLSHENVINHFKEIANKQTQSQLTPHIDDDIDHKSYFAQEIDESQLIKRMKGLSISNGNVSRTSEINWKVDLIVSELSRPGKQQSGFYDYTETNPYLRYNNNKGLNHSIVNPKKGNLDLADGAIMLMSKTLKSGGKFILKLTNIDNDDGEIAAMKQRLQAVFFNVHEINLMQDCIFVCLDKRE
ncbi:MRM2 [Candida theae]|uniref:rRNA methyltransferase 2, mitochondrial n=1 Tax=Candida theae TaxID=1198502 RepID=A0AAD5BFM9_9ASCO|nr:MRM2 [Candida theae]KAI5959257.1 MRM2 [Candida theae]